MVADGHPIVREGLAAMINRVPGMRVVAEASTGRAAVALFFRHRPDIALMELRMPKMNGVEAIEAIRKKVPRALTAVLTMYTGDEDVYRAMRAGAKAYLLKDAAREELLGCIRAVLEGKTWISPAAAASLAPRVGAPALALRQSDVLRLMVAGKSNKEIGAELRISEGTVKVHVNRIFKILGVSGRTGAVSEALRRGIIHLRDY